MKKAALALVLLVLLPTGRALAHGRCADGPDLRSSCCDPPARWGPRHDADEARIAITTGGRDVTLLLTLDVVALQLSDRRFHRVCRELHRRADVDDDGNILAEAIEAAVLSGVRALLDHSAECPIRDLRDVEYRRGRLIFTTEDGERIFEDMSLNDRDVMRDFSERDARAFVREFQRVKGRSS